MTDRALGWGLMGTARVNRHLIPALRASAGNRLVAVASRDAERAAAYARVWGIARAYGSYQALLEDPAVEVVYVPLPNHLHAEWAVRAARSGRHVLCEKPLALSVAEVEAIEAAAREGSVVVAEAFMYRHHPQTAKLKQLVDERAVGALRFLRGSFTFPLTQADDIRLRPECGGGCLWDVGCYPLSLLRLLAGCEPVEVYGSAVVGQGGVDETFAGQLVFPGGVLAQVDAGFRSAVRASVEVVGSEGVLRLLEPWRPSPASPIELTRGGTTETIATPAADRCLLEVEDLERAARGRDLPRISLAESRGNVATIVALLASARLGRPVRLSA
ncbi:MAG TPA: Gfo/Idh/MocA family oxidoreductase [Vicinamibacteria bacterium]|nr:Gfo/Idh/MocA family oxidoreductase [Vicinamibacteria bacterium]